MADFDRLPEIIRELETEVEKAVRLAVEELVVPTAKSLVPKDSGDLAAAIHTELALEGLYVIAGGRVTGDRDVYYGRFVERGHEIEHGGAHVAPRPFLVPALEMHREEIVERAAEAVRKATG